MTCMAPVVGLVVATKIAILSDGVEMRVNAEVKPDRGSGSRFPYCLTALG